MSEPRWQAATATTIGRMQRIFALRPLPKNRADKIGLTDSAKIRLMDTALAIVQAQGRTTNGPTEFWNTYVNTLRILVGSLADDVDPKDLDFD